MFKRQMKESRRVDGLILMFAQHATGVLRLRKDATLSANGKWNVGLNNHIVQFIKLLRESLRNLSHVTPELMARMDVYAAKGQTQSDPGDDSSSTSHRDSFSSSPGTSSHTADMPMVNTVARLFQIRADLHYPEVDKLRICTKWAALLDLKTCLKNIAANEPFPGCREDFDNEVAWQFWKTLETSHISQLMVVLVKFNPELAKSTPDDVLSKRSSVRGPIHNTRPGREQRLH
ncbi:hypothetical protein BJV78DRAFT_683785 [Lactifluus subvellereus]|nr:hypothetical protein BJV78DRAFT_683785 [Lactifluus subvellereus]